MELVILSTYLILLFHQGIWANICKNTACVQLAKTFLRTMDLTQDPCENFYLYACGKYLKETVIKDDEADASLRREIGDGIMEVLKEELELDTLTNQPTVFRKAKDFYKSCTDTDAIDENVLKYLKKMLLDFGGWPVLTKDWNEESFNWIELTKKIAEAGFPYNMIINVKVDVNHVNVTESIIQLDKPETGIDNSYLSKGLDDVIVQTYYKAMVDVAVELGADRSEAETQLMDALKFEMDLVAIIRAPSQRSALPLQYVKIPELQSNYLNVNWISLITSVLGEYVQVKSDDIVELMSPGFVERLGSLLQKTPNRVIANHIFGQLVFSSRTYLNSRISDISQNLKNAMLGTIKAQERTKFCIYTMKNDFKAEITPILATVYVQNHMNLNHKVVAAQMVQVVRKQLMDVITQADWLDPETRAIAVGKVSSIRASVDFPNILLNNEYMETYFQTLDIGSKNLLKNTLNIRRFRRRVQINRLYKPFNVRSWEFLEIINILQPNGQYLPFANSLVIFSGLLKGFLFDSNRPISINLATLGGIVSHEFTHSIDILGARFDKFGNYREWWNRETKQKFTSKALALVKEYSTYVLKELNITINARRMMGEIIADEGGYKTAFQALQNINAILFHDPRLIHFEQFSASKLFWIGNAVGWCKKVRVETLRHLMENDPHPPAEIRVNGPYRNSIYFGDVWNCPAGSYMNPKEKYNIW